MHYKCEWIKTIITNINYILNTVIILFLIGALGLVLNRKSILITIMSIELMLLAVNFNFILYSVYLDDAIGQLFAVLILTVAAAESAIGLAILVVYYRFFLSFKRKRKLEHRSVEVWQFNRRMEKYFQIGNFPSNHSSMNFFL